MQTKSVCYGCLYRTIGCHAFCDKYEAERQARTEENEAIRHEKERDYLYLLRKENKAKA